MVGMATRKEIFQQEVEEKDKVIFSHAGEVTPEPRVQRTCAENPLCTEHAQGRVGKGSYLNEVLLHLQK